MSYSGVVQTSSLFSFLWVTQIFSGDLFLVPELEPKLANVSFRLFFTGYFYRNGKFQVEITSVIHDYTRRKLRF
jgi:hypothetical protein